MAADEGELPTEPGKADAPGFSIRGGRGWYLVGNALSPGDNTIALTVTAPSTTAVVDVWLDGHRAGRALRSGTTFEVRTDITTLAAGDHTLLLQADSARVAFSALRFKRSHPLYVAVTNDWDNPDNSDDKLERQERLHARHPHLVITHFVGPYTFTDPGVTPARARLLATSTSDPQADAAPHLPILEVPDNGALVDYVTTAEMIEMFGKNFSGAALTEPTEYTIGYHPPNFSEALFTRIDGALIEIDKHLAVTGAGPVIYARMSELTRAFPAR